MMCSDHQSFEVEYICLNTKGCREFSSIILYCTECIFEKKHEKCGIRVRIEYFLNQFAEQTLEMENILGSFQNQAPDNIFASLTLILQKFTQPMLRSIQTESNKAIIQKVRSHIYCQMSLQDSQLDSQTILNCISQKEQNSANISKLAHLQQEIQKKAMIFINSIKQLLQIGVEQQYSIEKEQNTINSKDSKSSSVKSEVDSQLFNANNIKKVMNNCQTIGQIKLDVNLQQTQNDNINSQIKQKKQQKGVKYQRFQKCPRKCKFIGLYDEGSKSSPTLQLYSNNQAQQTDQYVPTIANLEIKINKLERQDQKEFISNDDYMSLQGDAIYCKRCRLMLPKRMFSISNNFFGNIQERICNQCSSQEYALPERFQCEVKKCRTCDQFKQLDQYYVLKQNADGLDQHCRDCKFASKLKRKVALQNLANQKLK